MAAIILLAGCICVVVDWYVYQRKDDVDEEEDEYICIMILKSDADDCAF